jgi:hypothetical protein
MALIHETQTSDVAVVGTIAATNGTVSITFAGRQSCSAVIAGTWTGTLVIEGSADNSTWVGCWFSPVNTSETFAGIPVPISSTTVSGTYKIFNAGGFAYFRVRASVYLTGPVSVTLVAVNAPLTFTYMTGAIIQQVAVDPHNSNENPLVNIAAGITWEGESCSTLGVAGIQVNLYTTQNCTIYVDQSMDGTNWDITDTFNYYYGLGGNSWTVQATASYFRVRVKNNGAIATTTFRLQTALCPIVEAVPRSLSAAGNLKTDIEEINGIMGTAVKITPIGSLRTSTHTRLVGSTFSGSTFDANFWTKGTPAGSGAANLANGQMTVTTGATINSGIIVNSTRIARYVGGVTNYFRGAIRVPAVVLTGYPSAANVRRWGAFDANNGYFFETDGTNLSVVCRKTASDANKISSGSFNGTVGSAYVLGTNCTLFEIYWTNRSAWFFIDDILIHKFIGATAPLCDTTHLKVGFQTLNSGGCTGANILEVRSGTINRLGEYKTAPQWYHVATNETRVLKQGPGVLHRVMCNSPGGAGNTIILYDDLTAVAGNMIASIDLNKANITGGVFDYELSFNNGLTYVTSASVDMTIIYE